MKSGVTVSGFEGLELWTVRVGRFIARGTAPRGSRPESWSVQGFLGIEGRCHHEEIRHAGRYGRAMSKVLAAIETGRI